MNSDESRRAEELLKSTAQNVGELASLATHQIEDTVSKSAAKLSEMQELIGQKARECIQTTDVFVRENPWQAAGWAAGLGLAIGLLLRRR